MQFSCALLSPIPYAFQYALLPMQDEQGDTFKGIVFKPVARKSLFYV
jgi:hypothetical protein